MDSLKIIYDILEQTLTLDDSEIGHEYTEIQFNVFSKDDVARNIGNTEFKFIVSKDGNTVVLARYPIEPIKYELIKTSTIGASMQLLGADTTYHIEAYVGTIDSFKEIARISADVVTSKGPQPFPSWTFDSNLKTWVPPIPNPDPSTGVDDPITHKLYQWSEKRQMWVEGLPEEVIVQDGGTLNN